MQFPHSHVIHSFTQFPSLPFVAFSGFMLRTAGDITSKGGSQLQRLVNMLRSEILLKHLCFVLAWAEALTIVNGIQKHPHTLNTLSRTTNTPPPQHPLPYTGCCCGCCGAETGAVAGAATAVIL